jgi:hypothetical protein
VSISYHVLSRRGRASLSPSLLARLVRPEASEVHPDARYEGCAVDPIETKQVEGARDQSLFREVNERIDELGGPYDLEVLCECANRACADPIPLKQGEYDGVRAKATHFFVKPGHLIPEIERVVGETDRYMIVEKFGRGGQAAERLDPRSRSTAGDDGAANQ